MGGKFTFTFESREQVKEMFSLKVYFIDNNLSNNFLFIQKPWEMILSPSICIILLTTAPMRDMALFASYGFETCLTFPKGLDRGRYLTNLRKWNDTIKIKEHVSTAPPSSSVLNNTKYRVEF